jgi:hypothetical protein
MDPQATLDAMHRMMIKREVALWFSSGRAIHAWRLRRIFRQAGWTVPEEIETYLDAGGDRLCEADLTSPEQVANAFELDRKGRNANVSSDRLAAAEHVFALKAMDPKRPITKIFSEVAECLNSKQDNPDKDAGSFVREAYYEWLENIHFSR